MNNANLEPYSQNINIGEVLVEGPVNTADLEKMYMNEGLKSFRPADRQKEALLKITALPEGMIYVARIGQEIIGYLTFHYPSKYSRWSKHPRVLELGGIEVSAPWRKKGISTALLQKAFTNRVVEEYIVVAIEFCWHWDLRGSGLSLLAYHRMMINAFKKVGLMKRATDDPDILEDPANVLTARIGRNVSEEDILLFENMLFENRQDLKI
ncbi:GNAT family N-acetyltransferase [Pelotomaculum terephthalicicum JT]|uniref:GNAT family N-acetyltransferase n=1 Tax=Pelotomaculum terephthalicicum TaxID=206393 RepID=UPI0009CC2A6B|nr:GNAT family N-acetyltransferase [Pelotomaculum terephthalicicum]MCG9969794.1 GNAT family N-acetyltransferase [Pelotomaculum terephthalicicum JT]OPX89132.1 MAG: Acetoin utilization protein AcuA [Pelotomaculum sp. PtaB.Bin104]OPY60996.1 MAG: Acetoin utilization protein AcuA [Pelotomaculum sp. PtaU1.Bin065]